MQARRAGDQHRVEAVETLPGVTFDHFATGLEDELDTLHRLHPPPAALETAGIGDPHPAARRVRRERGPIRHDPCTFRPRLCDAAAERRQNRSPAAQPGVVDEEVSVSGGRTSDEYRPGAPEPAAASSRRRRQAGLDRRRQGAPILDRDRTSTAGPIARRRPATSLDHARPKDLVRRDPDRSTGTSGLSTVTSAVRTNRCRPLQIQGRSLDPDHASPTWTAATPASSTNLHGPRHRTVGAPRAPVPQTTLAQMAPRHRVMRPERLTRVRLLRRIPPRAHVDRGIARDEQVPWCHDRQLPASCGGELRPREQLEAGRLQIDGGGGGAGTQDEVLAGEGGVEALVAKEHGTGGHGEDHSRRADIGGEVDGADLDGEPPTRRRVGRHRPPRNGLEGRGKHIDRVALRNAVDPDLVTFDGVVVDDPETDRGVGSGKHATAVGARAQQGDHRRVGVDERFDGQRAADDLGIAGEVRGGHLPGNVGRRFDARRKPLGDRGGRPAIARQDRGPKRHGHRLAADEKLDGVHHHGVGEGNLE